MPTVHNCEFTAAVVEALSLQGRKVKSIDLHFDTEEPVTATIVEWITDVNTGKLVEFEGKYEVTIKPDLGPTMEEAVWQAEAISKS